KKKHFISFDRESSPAPLGNLHPHRHCRLRLGNRRLRLGNHLLRLGNRRLRLGNHLLRLGNRSLRLGNHLLRLANRLLRLANHLLRLSNHQRHTLYSQNR
ncbi:unnamed protein product, partial [Brassica rapa]